MRLENRYTGQLVHVTFRVEFAPKASSAHVTLSQSAMPSKAPFISQTVMDHTWRSVGASTGSEIGQIQKRALKTQPALTRFVYDHALDLREDAAGVGMYIYHVIVETFGTVNPSVKKVKAKQVASVWQTLGKDIRGVREDDIAVSAEPVVLQYAVDALTEDDDVVLSDEELEILYAVLRTAIECLHKARRTKHV